MRTILAAVAVFATILALSDQPAPLDAAPVNVAPQNPSGNEAALRAEIERLTLALAESEARHSTVAPVVSPAHVAVTEGEAVAATGCANGQCSVPRARVQYASTGRTYQRQTRRSGPVRRLFGR